MSKSLSKKYPKGAEIEYLYTVSRKTNEKCPFGMCGGDGDITEYYRDNRTNEIEKRRGFCECILLPDKESLKRNSNIPEKFKNVSISSFDTSLYVNKNLAVAAKKTAIDFIRDFEKYKEKNQGLYLFSNVNGSGKTRLACSIGNALMETKRYSIKFMLTINMLNMIKSTYRGNTDWDEFNVLNNIKKSQILILDDIGAERPTEWANGIFVNILDYRITNNLLTIFTSNIRQEDLLLDDRSKSRIKAMSVEVHLPEEKVREMLAGIGQKEIKNTLFSQEGI